MIRPPLGPFRHRETVLVKALNERTVIIVARYWNRYYFCQKSPDQPAIWYHEDELMKTTQPPEENNGSSAL